jgi:hypothetical protein
LYFTSQAEDVGLIRQSHPLISLTGWQVENAATIKYIARAAAIIIMGMSRFIPTLLNLHSHVHVAPAIARNGST